MNRDETPRIAWALTGSGHYLDECLALAARIEHLDFFLSRAAAEVLTMYGHSLDALRGRRRVFRDNTASAAPVSLFYQGHYRMLVIAPATSNTVAKLVYGVSDTLVSNIYAQAGKCRIPSVVFACDTAPELVSRAPRGEVPVYPRRIDLENRDRLMRFEFTDVVESVAALTRSVERWLQCPSTSCS